MLRIEGLGQTRQLDPMIRLGLDATVAVLAPSDPEIRDTARYIERIVVAPPLFPSAGAPGRVGISKVSDVNPYLAVVANVREHQVLTLLGLLAIPLVSFLLGRASARR